MTEALSALARFENSENGRGWVASDEAWHAEVVGQAEALANTPEYHVADAKERYLLVQLRNDPGDAQLRLVYADWLEQHGAIAQADFLRGNEQAEVDPLWRALVVVSGIEDALAGVERELFRVSAPGEWLAHFAAHWDWEPDNR